MNYRIEEKAAFKVIEKVKMFSTRDESAMKEIPDFWQQARSDGTIKTLCDFSGGNEFPCLILGICYGDGTTSAKDFPYAIASGYNGKEIPTGFRINEIPANTWAIFKCKGAMPNAIQELWKQLYQEFFPTSDYAPKNEIDFEVYPDADITSPSYESEIWIAVAKK